MSRSTGFLAAASALVAVALVLAFVALGSPSHVRGVVLDSTKVSDLTSIARSIDGRYPLRVALPDRMVPTDYPDFLTGPAEQYAYRRDARRRYELCATFENAAAPDGPAGTVDDPRWAHPAGRSCFRFDADAAAGHGSVPTMQATQPSST